MTTRRRRLYQMAAYVLSVLSVASVSRGTESAPNFVVIYSDDQGWTSSSVQMDPELAESKSDYFQTPSLERLASEGMRFGSAYAEPICSPSRAAIQTGKSPAQLQMTDVSAAAKYDNNWYGDRYNGKPLSAPIQPRNLEAKEVTLSEQLKQINPQYVTGHFGKWHISRDLGETSPAYGYDTNQPTHSSSEYPDGDPKQIFSYTDTAVDFISDRVQADEPFYLQVSHSAPHAPFEARAATIEKYNSLPSGTNHSNPIFAAMLEDMDAGIGMLLGHLDQIGVRDNTYVVFVSDNGGIAGLGPGVNAPLYHSKGTVFEGGVRVPMIVSGPGIEPGSASAVPVTIRDLFATFSDLAGDLSAVPHDVESASLVPILENGGLLPGNLPALKRGFAPGGELFFHSPHYQKQPAGFTDRRPQSAVRDGDFKLVRIYGENSQPDRLFLFDLSQDLRESEDLNSPLNLVLLMPEKTAQLNSKLDRWLQDVDASMPFQVWDPIELRWNGDLPGADADAWRSTIDVDHHFRETWFTNLGQNGPTRGPAESFQPQLPGNAFRFDGSQGLSRHFFHVSDNELPDVYDADHSASFEFWLRTDDLTSQQLIFETGDEYAGVSLSLGDGDSNGVHNEIRANVRGGFDGGRQELAVTAQLDRFADPTADFVHVAVVVSDNDNDRYLELYINGARFARRDGGIGPENRLSWDDWLTELDLAGLGMAGGTTVGGSGGSGDQPFASGNFRGEVALMQYANFALAPEEIQSRYNENLHWVDFGVVQIVGDAVSPAVKPVDITLHAAESAEAIVVHERSDALDAALPVDVAASGPAVFDDPGDASGGQLAAGTMFSSFVIHFDPPGSDGSATETVAGSIAFAGEILALQLDSATLENSDGMLGSIGMVGESAVRGLLLGNEGTLEVLGDGKTLSFNLTVSGDEMLQFRVLTALIREADFQFDGNVDSVDLAIWESAYGSSDAGDAGGDNATQGDDFLVWQRQIAPTAGITAVVPEPATAAMSLALALCSLLVRRQRLI
ncbi:sulfatase-like hydrolase/transferase [Pirellulales bacterium]|nr:sulfatase-like hydrolase/transferase [Pirellulales bacterium]